MKQINDAWKKILYPPQYNYLSEYELNIDIYDHELTVERIDFQVISPITKS